MKYKKPTAADIFFALLFAMVVLFFGLLIVPHVWKLLGGL